MSGAAPASRTPKSRPGLLDWVERAGNALPHPATMFLMLAGLVALASWIAAAAGLTVHHPKDGTPIVAVNLLNRDGVRRMFTEAVRNFTGFAPLGTVLVAMLGVGVAEASGLISASLRGFAMAVPRSLLTAAVVFLGINANQAADAGIIVLPPVAAMLFAAAGRHPIAGLAAAYAGVSGGFSANLLPSSLDVLLIGFTQEAVDASRLLPGYHASVLGNWFFLAAATPLLTVAGTWVTERVVEPRLGPWRGGGSEAPGALAAEERRGLVWAGVALLAAVVLALLLTLPAGAPLRADAAGGLDQLKPFFDSIVLWVMLVFLLPGLAYGVAAGKIRSDHDAARMAGEAMSAMGTYIVLAFACAQFVSWFAWSNLAAILAISGARFLQGLGLNGATLLAGFVLFAAFLNLFTVSASAKWAVLAPVFVPMFALLGFTPEATQAVYRIGDSSTNIITPLMPYLPFVLACAQRYDPKVGNGTMISLMLPYSGLFLVLWTGLLLVFYWAGWALGPGVGMRLPG